TMSSDCALDVPVCVNGACCNSLCNGPCLQCDSVGQCVHVPLGASDPNGFCASDLACGPATVGCVGKAGAVCNPGLNGGDCLSQVCTSGKCAKGSSGKPCNTNADCTSGNCQSYV